jgi:hypothetical protein
MGRCCFGTIGLFFTFNVLFILAMRGLRMAYTCFIFVAFSVLAFVESVQVVLVGCEQRVNLLFFSCSDKVGSILFCYNLSSKVL